MSEPVAATSLLEQYEGVKRRYPGHVVLFRVGDFYETFGDDAKQLARELDLTLTARAPDSSGERLPMAGVPHHALDGYLARLVQKGHKVAVCDQVEDARVARGLVRREVTRVVSPGTVVEERILPGPDHNFLAAVSVPVDAPAGFALVDITTGEWFDGVAAAAGVEALLAELAPFAPRELLVEAPAELRPRIEAAVRREFAGVRLEPTDGTATAALPPAVAPPADAPAPTRRAAATLAAFVATSQPRILPFLERVGAPGGRRLLLDAKSLRHLEVTRPMNPDDRTGPTLLGSWDETVTAPGRRTLAFWLRHPLADVGAIRDRQEAVAALAGRGAELLGLRAELRPVADLSRIATRLASRRLRPPELAALRTSLRALAAVRRWIDAAGAPSLAARAPDLAGVARLADRLAAAVPDEPPPTAEGPGLFRPGFSAELDGLARDEAEGLAALEELERTEQAATGIRSLKVGYNQVFGYYLEVTRPHLAKVPERFRRKQTLAGSERFITDALAETERRILGARERRGTAEARAWEEFLVELEPSIPALHRLCRAVGELDTLATFALLAQERGLVRPVVDESRLLTLRDARHPVLDRTLEGGFVPNDTDLDADGERLLVLTGPNMAGKSTYMRQVGLLVLLAQVGAFVPARYARVGLVTGLFTRMGFTDEIGRGKSSFMVEMSEVAEIVRAADGRSLVLLDEIGRGTSTFDGLALAWATLRYLDEHVGARTILATHYHQLTELIESLPGARNAHLAVREDGGEVVFLHRLVPGSTDRSYGLHVARLAGLPDAIVDGAARLLKRLEADGGVAAPAGRGRTRAPTRYTQAVLLPSVPGAEAGPSPFESALRAIDPERLTPMEALRLVAEWRARLTGGDAS